MTPRETLHDIEDHEDRGRRAREAAPDAASAHLLVVDDEETVRHLLADVLRGEGFHVTAVADPREAIEVVDRTPVQLLLTDLKMPGMDGIELLQRVRRREAGLPVIVMTAYGTIDQAVEAIKAGAAEFVTKPFDLDAVVLMVRKTLDVQRLRREHRLLKATVQATHQLKYLIGTSRAMQDVYAFAERVADCDSTVLIQGESGTGKELLARMLHFNSARREGPWVAMNCAALPEPLVEAELFGHEKGAFTGAVQTRQGRFELAHGGTLFLDEVGEMSSGTQVRLLRVLQERCLERVGGSRTIHVDVRIIAATNQDLERMVRDGRFRRDLYYRLSVIPMTMPPLRERVEDIPLLVDHFLSRFNKLKGTAVQGVEPAAMARLCAHAWPGNVRELENAVEWIVTLKRTGLAGEADLPRTLLDETSPRTADGAAAPATGPAPPDVAGLASLDLVAEIERYETQLIQEALRRAGGVTSRAARLLSVNRTTLVEKLKRKGILRSPSEPSPGPGNEHARP
jgi:DNA-binding NtrC family response regulator